MRAGLGVLLLSAALLWQVSHGLRQPQSQRLSPPLRTPPHLLSRGVAVRTASTSLRSVDTSIAEPDAISTPPLRAQGLRWVWASAKANQASFLAQSRSRIAGALVVLALCFGRVAGDMARAHGSGGSDSTVPRTSTRTSTSSLRHSLSKQAGAVRSAFRGRSVAKLELAVSDAGTGAAASGIHGGGGGSGGGGGDARVSAAVKYTTSSNRGSGRKGKDQGAPSTADTAADMLQSGQEEVSVVVPSLLVPCP